MYAFFKGEKLVFPEFTSNRQAAFELIQKEFFFLELPENLEIYDLEKYTKKFFKKEYHHHKLESNLLLLLDGKNNEIPYHLVKKMERVGKLIIRNIVDLLEMNQSEKLLPINNLKSEVELWILNDKKKYDLNSKGILSLYKQFTYELILKSRAGSTVYYPRPGYYVVRIGKKIADYLKNKNGLNSSKLSFGRKIQNVYSDGVSFNIHLSDLLLEN